MEQVFGSSKSVPLSVIMPAYNEEDNIAAAVMEVQAQVLSAVEGAQLIVVNDGSQDRTGELVQQLANSDSRIVLINKPNAGHGPALIEGMKRSLGEYILLIDSDRQIPLDCFPELWRNVPDCDAVFGIRQNRQDPWLRLLLSSIIKAAVFMLFGMAASDINAPCKLFRRSIWEKFHSDIPADNILAPSIMLNIFARSHKYVVREMPLAHRARIKGKTSLNLSKLIPFCWHGLQQLMRYRSRLV